MSITLVGIVYSKANNVIQRHLYLDHDSHLDHPIHIGPGEAMVKIPIEHHHAGHTQFHDAIADAILTATGKPVSDGRCALINNETNIVENVIIADPEHYQLPGYTVILTQEASIGHKYNPIGMTFYHPDKA